MNVNFLKVWAAIRDHQPGTRVSVESIRMMAGVPKKEAEEILLQLHRMGHINGRGIDGLELPKRRTPETEDLYE